MGANEERIKNLRKKEQIEKIMKTRSNNNSKSIATRKKWDQVQPKSPLNVGDRSKSKEIKNTMGNNSSSKLELNSGTNLDEILYNMNRNVNNNLNKFEMKDFRDMKDIKGLKDMKMDTESPGNNRIRKNWGEPKYNPLFPDSITNSSQNKRKYYLY